MREGDSTFILHAMSGLVEVGDTNVPIGGWLGRGIYLALDILVETSNVLDAAKGVPEVFNLSKNFSVL